MADTYSIITTCKGRLHHLRQTLPSMLAQGAEEVIVVDYDCPDGTAAWVNGNYPTVAVVKAKDPKGFSASRARNMGAQAAKGVWLAFVDADNSVLSGWLAAIKSEADISSYFVIRPDRDKRDSAGTLVCSKRAFKAAGGYDEALRGWGGEDPDLRTRLSGLGLSEKTFASDLIQPISHDDSLRQGVGNLSIRQLGIRAQLYLRSKVMMNNRFGGMDQCCREWLLESLSAHVELNTSLRAKDHYPLKFFRYCPACAARASYNTEITVGRQGGSWWRPKAYQLHVLNHEGAGRAFNMEA